MNNPVRNFNNPRLNNFKREVNFEKEKSSHILQVEITLVEIRVILSLMYNNTH